MVDTCPVCGLRATLGASERAGTTFRLPPFVGFVVAFTPNSSEAVDDLLLDTLLLRFRRDDRPVLIEYITEIDASDSDHVDDVFVADTPLAECSFGSNPLEDFTEDELECSVDRQTAKGWGG